MVLASPAPEVIDSADGLRKAFYSPAEVAAIVGVSPSTILNYIRGDRLVAIRLSERTFRIPRKAVIRFLGLDTPGPRIISRPNAEVSG